VNIAWVGLYNKNSYSRSCSRMKMATLGIGGGGCCLMQWYLSGSKGVIFYFIIVGWYWVSSVCHSRDSSPAGIMSITAAQLTVCCVGMYLWLPSGMHERPCRWLCVCYKRGLGSTEHWSYRLAPRSGASIFTRDIVLTLQVLPWYHRLPSVRDLRRVTSHTKKKEKRLSSVS
jgi:hypothetical protein